MDVAAHQYWDDSGTSEATLRSFPFSKVQSKWRKRSRNSSQPSARSGAPKPLLRRSLGLALVADASLSNQPHLGRGRRSGRTKEAGVPQGELKGATGSPLGAPRGGGRPPGSNSPLGTLGGERRERDGSGGRRERGAKRWSSDGVCGAVASISAKLLLQPFDTVKTVLQGPPNIRGAYTNTLDCALGLARTGGVHTLYKGFLASLAVSAPSSAVFCAAYEFSKRALDAHLLHARHPPRAATPATTTTTTNPATTAYEFTKRALDAHLLHARHPPRAATPATSSSTNPATTAISPAAATATTPASTPAAAPHATPFPNTSSSFLPTHALDTCAQRSPLSGTAMAGTGWGTSSPPLTGRGEAEVPKGGLQRRLELLMRLTPVAAAFFGNLCSSIVRVPPELVKQRFQAGLHRSYLDAIRTLWASGGLRAFYVGYGTQVVRDMPYAAAQFLTFEELKRHRRLAKARRASGEGSSTEDGVTFLGTVDKLWMGAVAGAVACTLTFPLDAVKTRVMTQAAVGGGALNLGGMLRKVLAEEGVTALGRGLVPRLAYKVPASAIFLVCYELMQQLVQHSSASRLQPQTPPPAPERGPPHVPLAAEIPSPHAPPPGAPERGPPRVPLAAERPSPHVPRPGAPERGPPRVPLAAERPSPHPPPPGALGREAWRLEGVTEAAREEGTVLPIRVGGEEGVEREALAKVFRTRRL